MGKGSNVDSEPRLYSINAAKSDEYKGSNGAGLNLSLIHIQMCIRDSLWTVAGGTDVRIDDAERREWTDDNVCMEKPMAGCSR